MDNKELGLVEIFDRVAIAKDSLGITTFRRTPSAPIREKDLPCIFMLEDIDQIVKRSSRSQHGYPAQRVAEVIVEIVVAKGTDIKALYVSLRKAIFTEQNSNPPIYNPILAENVFINENRTEGPTGYGLPDVIGMRLVLDLIYTDGGF